MEKNYLETNCNVTPEELKEAIKISQGIIPDTPSKEDPPQGDQFCHDMINAALNAENETTEESDGTDPAAEEVEEVPEPHVISEEDPLNEVSQKQLGKLMKQVADMVKVMESAWCSSKAEFNISDTHVKLLYQYNEEHKVPMPEDLTPEQINEWDHFNGLNEIPYEEVEKIFGEGHPIIGVMMSQTIDRIKGVTSDFFSWMSALKEYRQIHDAYIRLVQVEEDKNIELLKNAMEKEEDSEKKQKMADSIEEYYHQKFLGFLAEPLDPKRIEKTVKGLSDVQKVEYWFKRSRDKMKQIKVSPKFLLEISQFEKRFLPEEYHCCNNVILLHFMQSVIYCDLYDKKSIARAQVVSMVFALDGIIRQTWSDEMKQKVFDNLMKFLDQFIDKVPRKTEE